MPQVTKIKGAVLTTKDRSKTLCRAGRVCPLYTKSFRELYGLPGDPTAIDRTVEYLLGDDRFMCPSKGYEVCIRQSPVAQPGLPITSDYDLDAAYIIPVPRASGCRCPLW